MQRDLPLPSHAVPDGVVLRPQAPDDIGALGRLYWNAYPRGVAAVSIEDAVEEMEAVFDQEYGIPIEEASLVAVDADGSLVGCVQVVTDAPWEGMPEGPFIIELFVHPDHRGRGLGRALLDAASRACVELGHSKVSLKSLPGESPEAYGLYLDLGFHEIA